MSAMLSGMTFAATRVSPQYITALQQYTPTHVHIQDNHTQEKEQDKAQGHDTQEISLLQQLAQQGVNVADILIIDKGMETDFYRLNNLPEQLSQLFYGVDLQHPDEDDIEEIAPQAQALLQQHYLLDEVIDKLYEVLRNAPDWLTLRYPHPLTHDVHAKVLRGRPALMHIKKLWQARWSYDALWTRVSQSHTIALQAYPIMIHAPIVAEDDALSKDSSHLLNQPVQVFTDATGAIVHLKVCER